ncbi:MAG TPA: HlyD family efflux transporter periplasmic adaptor subunit [Candidatus Paceibacterota bacterium]
MSETSKKLDRRVLVVAAAILLIIGGGAAGIAYIAASSHTVYIEKSQISAPTVDLSPSHAGVLRALNVSAGQLITPGTVVAQVGVELIKSTQGGLVIATQGDVGDQVAAGTPVVQMIDPNSLRVVGKIDENKGFEKLKVGDPVKFTVDAFGGKAYTGVVDEVSPTSNQSGVVFNISDQRQIQQFDVKARFDTVQSPELKNGMSARMWVWVK